MILTPDKVEKWNGVTVKFFDLYKHNVNKIAMPNEKRKETIGVTIHNTGAISVPSNTTMAETYVRSTYNGNMRDVRVTAYISGEEAWVCLPLDEINWSCADGHGNGNRKTLALEIIGDSKKAEDNGARIAAYLLNKYNLEVDTGLFTHTHWLNVRDGFKGSIDYLNTKPHTYKTCPLYIIPHWADFKAKVKSYLAALRGGAAAEKVNVSTSTTLYRVRKSWNDANSQLGAYTSLDNAKAACKDGYSVFDESGKEVYSKKSQAAAQVKPSTTTQTKPASTPTEKIDVTYSSYTNKWLGEIKNFNNSDSNGYSGIEGTSIKGFAAKASKGTLKYRVHLKKGSWLSWISKFEKNNWIDGCAGIKTMEIDAIQMELTGVKGYQVKYRVSTTDSKDYLSWITGYNNSNSNGYAGIFGKAIDKVQVEIVKV